MACINIYRHIKQETVFKKCVCVCLFYTIFNSIRVKKVSSSLAIFHERSSTRLLFSASNYQSLSPWGHLKSIHAIIQIQSCKYVCLSCRSNLFILDLTTYLNHSLVRFLEPTSTGVIWGIMVVTCVGFEPTMSRLRGRHLIH